MLTAIKGDTETCFHLLDFKANADAGDKNGKTALMYAIEYQSKAIIERLSPSDPKKILDNKFNVYNE